MAPLFAAIDGDQAIAIGVPIIAVFVVAMTAILTAHHRKMQRDDMEATLKMEMVQRGVSADEIERVLAARMGKPSRHRRGGGPQWKPQQQREPGAHPVGR